MLSESATIYGSASRKIQSALLRAIAKRGQKNVADNIGKSETWVSRWLSDGGLENTCDLLATLHLKVVPVTMKCYDSEELEHLRFFAKRGMDTEPKLVEDWDE